MKPKPVLMLLAAIGFWRRGVESPAGAESALLEGTATYNIPDLKPEVVQEEDGKVILKQGEYRVDGLPSFDDMENRWDLCLGAKPNALFRYSVTFWYRIC